MPRIKMPQLVALLGLTLMLSGCFSARAYVYDKSHVQPKPANHAIEVHRTRPSRAYDEIAHLKVSPTFAGFSTDQAVERLKAKARDVGADAIIEVDLHVSPAGAVQAGQVSATAIAVRWR